MKKRIIFAVVIFCMLMIGGCLEQKKDVSLPEITMKGTDVVKLVGTEYVDEGVFANDEQDGDITNKIEKTIYNGSNEIVNTIDGNKAETYTIKYNVSDNAGNKANEVTRIVVFSNLEKKGPILTFYAYEYWMVATQSTPWGAQLKFASRIQQSSVKPSDIAWDTMYMEYLERKFVKGKVYCRKYENGFLKGTKIYNHK